MRTSVISPLGIFTDRSASCIVTLVGRRSPNPSYRYIEKGRRLMLAPRSSNALFIVVYPIIQEMVGDQSHILRIHCHLTIFFS